jgi:ATP-dependent DNA helicase
VVDEGHRLKNFNCKLIRELKTLQTENRLLLTGRWEGHVPQHDL